MRVMGNRVLVKRLDEPALKSDVIEVVSLDREPGMYAVVAGVGPGRRLQSGEFDPLEVSVGDVVILAKYSGAPVTLHKGDKHEEFQIVDGEDVLAVVQR